MTTIYLSSTYTDLKEYRKTVFDALRQSGYQVIAMEDYVAKDERPLQACLDDVDRADIYVGLFAFRYGYIPSVEHGNPESLSITELEFRRADASPNTHCLTFLTDKEAAWPLSFVDSVTGDGEDGTLIQRLRDDLSREKMAGFFSTPYELASKVQSAVSQYLATKSSSSGQPAKETPGISWDIETRGSPYPGLMHFTRPYAPVFFGRESEVRELLDRLTTPESRFMIISGDSGSGKSSLVDAGVLSRLEDGSEQGSFHSLRMLPSGGSDPFDALLRALQPLAEHAGLDAYQLGRDLADGLQTPEDVLGDILTHGLQADQLLLFLDQLEELYTARENDPALVQRFLTGLYTATQTLPLQVLATIRSDLLHHCYAHQDLIRVLNGRGHYALGKAAPHNLHDMIVRPAQCAGVTVPEPLAGRLIADLGAQSGNLPLLAFVLQRLFAQRRNDTLTLDDYQAMGGLTGAIAEHVGEVERDLERDLKLHRNEMEQRLAGLFELLVRVDIEGLPTRRRVPRAGLPEDLDKVVEALVKARLLTTEGEGAESELTVAHERLFEAWPALTHWVAEHQDDLRLLRQGELEATEWQRQHHDLSYLWHPDRLKRLQEIIQTLPPERADETLRNFAWPQPTLIQLLKDPEMTHGTRDSIGHTLTVLGDPRSGVGLSEEGTPDIDWVKIPGGKIVLKGIAGSTTVASFHMARYLITNAQFQAFIDATDGYAKADWWQGMPDDAKRGSEKSRWAEPNQPRETVTWYETVAFCRWLSQRLGFKVRLPTEFEWQQAATGGDPNNGTAIAAILRKAGSTEPRLSGYTLPAPIDTAYSISPATCGNGV
ncbi:MAG: SUMF1/EgtB/PvdO family nonheme iron enzyme [Candidatus Thiodiazotropha sp.]